MEQLGLELRWHAGAMIDNPNLDLVAHGCGLDLDGGLAIPEGVLHVVLEHPSQVKRVDPHLQVLGAGDRHAGGVIAAR